MRSLQLAVLLSVPTCLYAFADTKPLLAWSSTSSPSLDSIASRGALTTQSESAVAAIVQDACGYDAVIVIEQPGLHNSDLKNLPKTSFLAEKLHSSPSSLHIPYIQDVDPQGIVPAITKQCDSQTISLSLGDSVEIHGDSPGMKTIVIDLPELQSHCGKRKQEMRELDAKLSQQLSSLAQTFPSHLVVLAGTIESSFSRAHSKRRFDELQRALPSEFVSPTADQVQGRAALPKGGIFHRYQLLTPGLITSIGITFGLLLPFMLIVINALASIKSPVRSEGIKQATEKKNQ
ncbi:hypothetical protein FRC04_006345 [Tulasnella sp. 424]|nr:hypothetical protein FRC04_006345 [Tulasnella sp. 424]KAG8980397.1 hypothetical protein FRC05_006028 [Tulasnella sp. 425]